MPSYNYACSYCHKEWIEIHSFDEGPTKCPFCEQEQIKKIYNYTPTIIKTTNDIEHKKSKVGSKTREFIEQARENLKEYKEEQK